jgi:DNA-directed RNA polymerase specialized sigma24 family protein
MRSWSAATDETLLTSAVRDRAAFATFYERHERDVLGFFGAVTRRPELAADLTAETFAAALEGAAQFDSTRGSARMWLFGIARNLLAGSARRGRVESAARRRIGLDPLVLRAHHIELIEELVARARATRSSRRGWPSCPPTRRTRSGRACSTSAPTRTSPATCAAPRRSCASA